MQLPSRGRRAVSTVLALLLAVESVSAVAAAAITSAAADAGTVQAAPAFAPAGPAAAGLGAAEVVLSHAALPAALASLGLRAAVDSSTAVAVSMPNVVRRAVPDRAPRVAVSRPKAARHSTAGTARSHSSGSSGSVAYRGTNHAWIPTLGINRSVRWFPCDRSRPPDNFVYRWGCAGHNNVYLLGHAWGVFKPLHDAYYSGRLRVGMRVWYADGSGRVHQYRVKWWKKTLPTTDASWAWAPQPVPSMTLQTCVGANSEYRLMVRLVRSG